MSQHVGADAVAWPRERVRGARRQCRGGAGGRQPDCGVARRGRHRQDCAARVPGGPQQGCRVVRVVGIESEMELPFAAVHQLCRPLLDGLERLPTPQREALETAFGLSSGRPPDRFFVGLAVLSQLSELAEAKPLVCLVDDAQWLDRSSAQVLSFVARRLHAESVVIVFAERDGDAASEFEGLPELRLRGLSEEDAAELVTSVSTRPTGQVGARPDHRRGAWQSTRLARAPARARRPHWLAATLSRAG